MRECFRALYAANAGFVIFCRSGISSVACKIHFGNYFFIENVYLAEQDKLRDLETENLKRQNEELATVTENQTNEIGKRQAEIERLAYSRKTEIDPDDYEMFKIGLKELTKTEKTVFDLYLQGKTAKEIADILNIRESTLKFHNHNILEKLGVSSRKQMLRYATLLKQEMLNE